MMNVKSEKNLKGNDSGLLEKISRYLPGDTEEYNENVS
jgi:hypothetical protein